eukprot:6181039-Pleurochrysis_carterae.AAC.1
MVRIFAKAGLSASGAPSHPTCPRSHSKDVSPPSEMPLRVRRSGVSFRLSLAQRVRSVRHAGTAATRNSVLRSQYFFFWHKLQLGTLPLLRRFKLLRATIETGRPWACSIYDQHRRVKNQIQPSDMSIYTPRNLCCCFGQATVHPNFTDPTEVGHTISTRCERHDSTAKTISHNYYALGAVLASASGTW